MSQRPHPSTSSGPAPPLVEPDSQEAEVRVADDAALRVDVAPQAVAAATSPARNTPEGATDLKQRCDTPEDATDLKQRCDTPEDATDLKQRCNALEHRVAELERDFHALSHSIRSPLVALKGFAGLLEEEFDSGLGDNGRHFLGRISEAGRRIETRLNDLAEVLSVYEQPPVPTWVDPVPVIEGLAGEFKPALDDTGMRLLIERDLPMIYCDRAKLALALTHLIGNALQHGASAQPHQIQIRAERDATETRVSVVDTGAGMEAPIEQRAFDLFDSAGDRTRRFDDGRESSGVGLALVRRIAESHGGEAILESGPDRGTRVVMSFPHE